MVCKHSQLCGQPEDVLACLKSGNAHASLVCAGDSASV